MGHTVAHTTVGFARPKIVGCSTAYVPNFESNIENIFHNYRCAYSTVPCQSKSTVSKKEYSQKNFSGYFLPYLGIQNCDQNLKEQESS